MSEFVESYVIVVGVDFSGASNHALDEALILASCRGGEVHVLHVEDEYVAEALLHRGLTAALNQDEIFEPSHRERHEARSGADPAAQAPGSALCDDPLPTRFTRRTDRAARGGPGRRPGDGRIPWAAGLGAVASGLGGRADE